MRAKVLMFAIAVIALASCSNKLPMFYQVYEVASPDVKTTPDVMVYENQDCRITYNLWANGGNLSFMIQNMTGKDLYLVMPRSFFILNGVASDYYSGATNTISLSMASGVSDVSSASMGLSGYAYYQTGQWFPTTISRSQSLVSTTSSAVAHSMSKPEKEIICIPPHASKLINGFALSDYVYKVCGEKSEKINYPKEQANVNEYTQEDTPLMIRNRLAYTFNAQGEDVQMIENTFYVQSVKNYFEKTFISKNKVQDCESNTTHKVKQFNLYAPQRFYNKYADKRNQMRASW